MTWNGEVPLLGFDDEWYHDPAYKEVLEIRVPKYGVVAVYAWGMRHLLEGYNIFFPNDTCPFKRDTVQARDPFTAKMIIQAYMNDIEHFIATGEIPHDHEIQSRSA